MATGPLDEKQVESLRAERDALAERCARAEQEVAALRAELASARARLAETEAGAAPLSLFEGDAPGERAPDGMAGDGSDPRILSLVLGATAVVAAMVTLLAFVNGNLSTPFGFAMVAITVGLAYAAARTRVQPVRVSVTRGVVYAEKGETTYRFDLRNERTLVEMTGNPGDAYWQVAFHRKGMDPFVVDTDMVDPHDFVRRLREYRPDL